MDHRGFFLRFNTEILTERVEAFRELCAKIGVDGAPYLKKNKEATAVTPTIACEPDSYTVQVDIRGEMLTYCEPAPSANVSCTFDEVPCIATLTLSNWYYPLGRRSQVMDAKEKRKYSAALPTTVRSITGCRRSRSSNHQLSWSTAR